MRKAIYIIGALAWNSFPALANQVIAPASDGTLVDGRGYGNFDGVADAADWSFNQSSFEGAITVSHNTIPPIEHRLVFEFNLNVVSVPGPVVAGFKFKLRGAPQFPAERAIVQIFSFPSDLVESLSDFSAGPAVLLGQIAVEPYQVPTLFEIDVSDPVNASLASGLKRVAFRLQLAPETHSAQAFLDALDSDPTTKPSLVLYSSLPGDFNNDGTITLEDAAVLSLCLNGPALTYPPGCSRCDLNGDGHVDLKDERIFEEKYSIFNN